MKNIFKSIIRELLKIKIFRYAFMTIESIYRDNISAVRYRISSIKSSALSDESVGFEIKGFARVSDIEILNIPILDELPDENVYSSIWDESSKKEKIVLGRKNWPGLFQQTFVLPDSILKSILMDIEKVRKRLEILKKRKFDLNLVTTYRFYPTNFNDFQSFLWHIDFVSFSNHDYKFMLFLNDVSDDNGPMLISDISLSRRFKNNNGYRFSDNYVLKNAQRIYKCTGKRGEGILFDTKFLHKGGRVIDGVRDVIVFSFNPGVGTYENARQIVGPLGENELLTEKDILF